MINLYSLSADQLRRIISIKEQIESLQHELTAIAGDAPQNGAERMEAPVPGKRKLSASHRRKLIKALAKARKIRWAKAHAGESAAVPKKRRLSAAGRAAIAAGARARWARARAAKA